jgi:two-component system response regulator ChvI
MEAREVGGRPRLVLVDDDPVFLRLLAENLEAAGYATVTHDDPRAGFAALRTDRPAACLFDWDMPGLDGLALLRALRAEGARYPILFLTGHASPMFEEAALAEGAVDFIDKSRGPAIVLRRVALALSRGAAPMPGGATDLSLGKVTLREATKRVLWRGSEVALSRGEYEIVALLVRAAGRDVPYRALYDALHGDGFLAGQGEEGYRANVRAMIKRIRRKFAEIDPDFDALGTYPGFGYRWQAGGG